MQTSGVTGLGNSTGGNAGRGLASMKTEDFFKIMVAEMQQQDPFEPTKTSDMITQVSQVRGIEVSGQLGDALSQLVQQQRTAGASDLIGRFVRGAQTRADGTVEEVAGVVTGVRFSPDGLAVLELDSGKTILAANVTHVSAKESAAGAATSAANAKPLGTLGVFASDGGTRTSKPKWLPDWLGGSAPVAAAGPA